MMPIRSEILQQIPPSRQYCSSQKFEPIEKKVTHVKYNQNHFLHKRHIIKIKFKIKRRKVYPHLFHLRGDFSRGLVYIELKLLLGFVDIPFHSLPVHSDISRVIGNLKQEGTAKWWKTLLCIQITECPNFPTINRGFTLQPCGWATPGFRAITTTCGWW